MVPYYTVRHPVHHADPQATFCDNSNILALKLKISKKLLLLGL